MDIAEYLSDAELDDDTVAARIGKVPEQREAPVTTWVDTNNPPPGYRVIQDEKLWPRAFRAFTRRGVLIRHKPYEKALIAFAVDTAPNPLPQG